MPAKTTAKTNKGARKPKVAAHAASSRARPATPAGAPLLVSTPLAPTKEIPAGAPAFELPEDMVLTDKVFGRYMGLVDLLSRRTGLTINVDQRDNALEQGDIYLFNHFTRFETVIAPYILHRETHKLVRSVAYHGLFDVNDTMTRIIRQSGAVPTNMPRLLPFLAEEILRGRKVIIFPEGGLVKDKNVLDANGDLKMWSGVAEKVRKPHRGAAVLALMLDLAKRRIRNLFEVDDKVQIGNWCQRLGLTPEQLRAAVAKPTLIVPANITFYPMRTNPNLLIKGFERFSGPLQGAARDEITIEGNLLMRPTDMDVRFGTPIKAMDESKRLHTALLDHTLANTQSMDDIFALKDDTGTLLDNYVSKFVAKHIDRIRDDYARRIYLGTTININHLTSTLVRILTREHNVWEMPQEDFHKVLYLMVKDLQQRTDVNLHLSLVRPDIYQSPGGGLLQGNMRGFTGFMEACTRAHLLSVRKGVYYFSKRLLDDMDLQDIRLENPIRVHANEATPIRAVAEVAEAVLKRLPKTTTQNIALLRFDDLLREHAGLRLRFGKKAPHMLLAAENPVHGGPYLLQPDKKTAAGKVGVLLVHGFAGIPVELRDYAEHLREAGHTVLGVRLAGHGTSILDLEDRHRSEWLASVREGYDILSALCEEVEILGFSTGGALTLQLAAQKTAGNLPKLSRIAVVAPPLQVWDNNIRFLPVGMVLRFILGHTPGLKNLLRFYTYDKDITGNIYHRVPVAALNQLRHTIAETWAALPHVQTPTLIVQGLSDHTVVPASAAEIYRRLGATDKTLRWVPGGPHNLVNARAGATWEILDTFLTPPNVGQPVTGNANGKGHKAETPIVAEARKPSRLAAIAKKIKLRKARA